MEFSVCFFSFMLIVLALFYLIKNKTARVLLLIISSFTFVALLGVRDAFILLITSLLTYIVAYFIDFFQRKGKNNISKVFLSAGITASLLNLFAFKYADWLLVKMMGISALGSVLDELIIPLGLSFYTFQVIDYLCDVYKGQVKYEKNPLLLICYLTYFPKLLSGPIEKSTEFIQNLNKLDSVRIPKGDRLTKAITCFFLGFFMKLCIADRANIFVSPVFNDPNAYGGVIIMGASLLYTIQIYCDFAGYSLIAIGVSEMFGIPLSTNFDNPYFSENITEFWRRWHITLGRFLKERIYIPLGGNRKGIKRQYINLFAVFVICGLWHGASVKFLVWGIMHGILSIISRWALTHKVNFLVKGISGRIITFLCVSFGWIFFESVYFRGALNFIKCMFFNLNNPFGGLRFFADKYRHAIVLFALIIVFYILERISYRNKVTLAEYICSRKQVVRLIILYGLIMLTVCAGIYGTEALNSMFIYMNF